MAHLIVGWLQQVTLEWPAFASTLASLKIYCITVVIFFKFWQWGTNKKTDSLQYIPPILAIINDINYKLTFRVLLTCICLEHNTK